LIGLGFGKIVALRLFATGSHLELAETFILSLGMEEIWHGQGGCRTL
jgi:hypothetical protein